MTQHSSQLKVGVYIDVSNIVMNGGFGMRYEVLRKFACRGNAEPMRLNAYVSYDPERGEVDEDYRAKQYRFHASLRDVGYKVIIKNTQWYVDETGNRFGKSNVDLDLAVDALLQSENLDRVMLVTGDGDFVQVVRALQNRGCRVEVIGFNNVSGNLRREADLYVSGYLIPNLLPIKRDKSNLQWGEVGSYARGVFYTYDEARGFGWLRFLTKIDGDLWLTDTRDEHSPYSTIFCHNSNLPSDTNASKLTNRQVILEYRIVPGNEEGKNQAVDLECYHSIT